MATKGQYIIVISLYEVAFFIKNVIVGQGSFGKDMTNRPLFDKNGGIIASVVYYPRTAKDQRRGIAVFFSKTLYGLHAGVHKGIFFE